MCRSRINGSVLASASVAATIEIKNLDIMPIRPLSKELQKKAEKELGEVSRRIEDDLKHIRDWLAQQPHLHARTDDQWLINFLRGCKFSLQRTKQKLDMVYTMRTAIPEFYCNRDPLRPEIQEVLKLGLFLPLPNTAHPAAPRVIILRCDNVDPSKILLLTVIKTAIMIVDILLNEDDNFVIAGQQTFYDLKGLTVNHLLQITPDVCKKTVVCLQDSYPTRPKGLHFINTSSMFEKVFGMVKALLDEKLKDRFHLYGQENSSDIHKAIPYSVLPKEYGGEGGSLDNITADWKKKVESYRDWFLEDEEYRSDESKRPGKPKTADELFGVEGSFRKLVLD